MQKITTKIFVWASIAFGLVGITLVLFGGPSDNMQPNITLMKILLACVFIILPSFALSVASKYLK
jgi:drug/metabolite transporter (DMT)-like permease